MARPLRIEYPGAYYHVINRGNNQEKILKRPGQRKVPPISGKSQRAILNHLSHLLFNEHSFSPAGGDAGAEFKRCDAMDQCKLRDLFQSQRWQTWAFVPGKVQGNLN